MRAPSLNLQLKRDGHELAAAGSWTAVHAGDLEALIGQAAQQAVGGTPGVSIDMNNVGAFDTYGAWLLERLIRERSRAGLRTEIAGLRDEYQGLLRDVHDVNREETAETRERRAARVASSVTPMPSSRSRAVRFRSCTCWEPSVLATARGLSATPSTSASPPPIHQLDRVGLAGRADHHL